MNCGKVTKAVFERSVFRRIKSKNKSVVSGTHYCGDSSVLRTADEEAMAYATATVVVDTNKDVKRCIVKMINNLACQGGQPMGIMLSILLPQTAEESVLKEIMQTADAVCADYQMQIAGGHTQVTSYVEKPVVTVTGVGAITDLKESLLAGGIADQDIVLTKSIGLEGSAVLAWRKEKELSKYLPQHMIQTAQHFDEALCVLKEAQIALEDGASFMHDLSEFGVFGALYEMAVAANNCGFEVELKKIPVRQETIEICEQFQINPYELASAGSLLILSSNGYALVDRLSEEGIDAVVVGRTTESIDKIILNDGERRHLEIIKQDALYQVIEG